MTRGTRADGPDGGSVSRRGFGRGVAAVAAGSMAGLSGCVGGYVEQLGATLAITGTAAQVTENNTNIIVTVENSGDGVASAVLWAQLSTESRQYEQEQRITVQPQREEAFTFTFDVTPRQFDYEAWIE